MFLEIIFEFFIYKIQLRNIIIIITELEVIITDSEIIARSILIIFE
jgi:hypothetical protein